MSMSSLEDGELEVLGQPHHSTGTSNPYEIYEPEYEWPTDNRYIPSLQESSSGDWSVSQSRMPHEEPSPSRYSSIARRDPMNDSPSELETTDRDSHSRSGSQHCLRFLVLRSGILPSKHRIVLADGFPELQIGRDTAPVGTSTPRVRLKEMEVSKLHASVYWDSGRKEWGIVDMGSKHGTFIKQTPKGTSFDTVNVDDLGLRISPPRVASMPRMLRHMDQLTIGSTTFLVHVHQNGVPCEGCSPESGCEEVPLFTTPKGSNSLKRSRTVAGLDSSTSLTPLKNNNPREALSMLKRSLLTRHDDAPRLDSAASSRSASPASAKLYVDRSARRRALHSASHLDAPGVPSLSTVLAPKTAGTVHHASASEPITPRAVTPEAGPPAPLAHTNIGYKLLLGQGWEPGTTLGVAQDGDPSEGRMALIEPLQLASSTRRAGLGTHTISGHRPPGGVSGERDKFDKFRRWQEPS